MKAHSKYHQLERGQALMIMVFAMVILLFLAALAIDVGFAFVQQRVVQNAADNCTLAGVYSLLHHEEEPTEAKLLSVIYDVAGQNDVIDPASNVEAFYTDKDGIDLVGCNVIGACGSIPNHTRGIRVITRKSVNTFFASILGSDYFNASAQAIAVLRYGGYLTRVDSALVALGGGCEEITFDGSGSTNYIIGGIHSNEDLTLGGSKYTIYGSVTIAGKLYDEGSNNVFKDGCTTGSPKVSDPFTGLTTSMFAPGGSEVTGMIVHDLSNREDLSGVSKDKIEIKDLPNAYYDKATRTLAPGVYYAGDKEIIFGEAGINGTVTMVTDGIIQISSSVRLNAYLDGLLFYSGKNDPEDYDPCENSVIKISGSGNNKPIVTESNGIVEWVETDSYLRGLIYAPHGQVEFSGSKVSVIGAVVSATIKENGSDLLFVKDVMGTSMQIELID